MMRWLLLSLLLACSALGQGAGPPDIAGPWISSTRASCVVPPYEGLSFTINVRDAQGRNPASYQAQWRQSEESGRWYFTYRIKSGEKILGSYSGGKVNLQNEKGDWSSQWTRY